MKPSPRARKAREGFACFEHGQIFREPCIHGSDTFGWCYAVVRVREVLKPTKKAKAKRGK